MQQTAPTCDPAALQSLLDGHLDEPRSQSLERHLETCSACQTRLDTLAAEAN